MGRGEGKGDVVSGNSVALHHLVPMHYKHPSIIQSNCFSNLS